MRALHRHRMKRRSNIVFIVADDFGFAPRLLRRPRAGVAGARPARRERPEADAGLCQFSSLFADALRADDGTLPVPVVR